MTSERKSIHGEWSSRWAFILAATGAAVGLGNIWKFPYLAGENGGGVFVLFYLLCILLMGIPLMMAEVLIGRHGRQNPANTMETTAIESGRSKHWKWVGGMCILAAYLILSYYNIIAGWALKYVFSSIHGPLIGASASEVNQLFDQFISRPLELIFWESIIIVATILVVAKGVQKGIERAVYIMFPALFVLLLVLIVHAMGTGYFAEGFAFLFKPNWEQVTGQSLLNAMGQAFFSLSLATGSIMMYGAYLPKDTSVSRASIIIALVDTLVAILAGLAIFPVVFAHGLEPAAGPGLIFKSLPLAFSTLPFGDVFSSLFFIMLVFSGFTSTISLLEPTVAWLMENFKFKRITAATIAGAGLWILGLGTVFSFNIGKNYTLFGKNFFELIDYLTANIMLPLGGLLISFFAGWLLKKEIARTQLHARSGYLYHSWRFAMRYIIPVSVLLVFLHVVGVL